MLPKLAAADAAGRGACCGGCGRGSSCRSAATPACRPCSPPGALGVPDRRRQLRPPAGPGERSWRPGSPRRRAVAFPDSPLPRAVVTGAPVRRRDPRRRPRTATATPPARALGLPADRFVVAVTGGSQGSAALNEAVAALRRRATPTTPGWPSARSSASASSPASPPVATAATACSTRSSATTTASSCVYAAADLLVGRGGASTVAEVAVTGTPAILVPWSGAAEDHQTLNVRWLADQGARGPAPRGRARHGSATLIDGLRADPAAARRRSATGPGEPASCTAAARLVDVIERVARVAGRVAVRTS